jgi:hypothetical protein
MFNPLPGDVECLNCGAIHPDESMTLGVCDECWEDQTKQN